MVKAGAVSAEEAEELTRETGAALAGLLEEVQQTPNQQQQQQQRGLLLSTAHGRRLKKALRNFAERQRSL
jgi:tripartite-type tricarboxylate transporter receptor subunit TctC